MLLRGVRQHDRPGHAFAILRTLEAIGDHRGAPLASRRWPRAATSASPPRASWALLSCDTATATAALDTLIATTLDANRDRRLQARRVRRAPGSAGRRAGTRRRGVAYRCRARTKRRGRDDHRQIEKPRGRRRCGKTRWKVGCPRIRATCGMRWPRGRVGAAQHAARARRRRASQRTRGRRGCGGTSRVARARGPRTRRWPCAAAGWRSTTCGRPSRKDRGGFPRRSWRPCTSSATRRASNHSPPPGEPPSRTGPRTGSGGGSSWRQLFARSLSARDHEATRGDEENRRAVARAVDVGL